MLGVREENRENLSGKENVADRHTDIIVKIWLEARGADLMGGPVSEPREDAA